MVTVKQNLMLEREFSNLQTDKALPARGCSGRTPCVSETFWSIGDVVRRCRDRKGWSQEELAKRAGLDKTSIVRLENASEKSKRGTLEKVAAALGITVPEMYERVEQAEWGARISELPAKHRRRVLALIAEFSTETDPA